MAITCEIALNALTCTTIRIEIVSVNICAVLTSQSEMYVQKTSDATSKETHCLGETYAKALH